MRSCCSGHLDPAPSPKLSLVGKGAALRKPVQLLCRPPRFSTGTPGRLAAPPVSLEMAEGRKLAEFEARECYSCHATALTTTEPLSAAHYQPGITCEALSWSRPSSCPQPWTRGDDDDLEIVNPPLFSAVSVDFCGACHSTPKDAELMGVVGPLTARFPAYRLEKSRCWGRAGDAGSPASPATIPISHWKRDAAAYDSACLRCHANGACRQRTRICASGCLPCGKVSLHVLPHGKNQDGRHSLRLHRSRHPYCRGRISFPGLRR